MWVCSKRDMENCISKREREKKILKKTYEKVSKTFKIRMFKAQTVKLFQIHLTILSYKSKANHGSALHRLFRKT